jgi:hypothetical protein
MIKYFVFFIVSNLLIFTVVMDAIVVREKACVLSLNRVKLEFGCIVELV